MPPGEDAVIAFLDFVSWHARGVWPLGGFPHTVAQQLEVYARLFFSVVLQRVGTDAPQTVLRLRREKVRWH